MKDRFAHTYFAGLLLMLLVSFGALAHLSACDPVAPAPDMAADFGPAPEPDLAEPAGPACVPCDYQPSDCGGVPSLCEQRPSGQHCCIGVAPIVCGTPAR